MSSGWLNCEELERRDGRYTGTIVQVTETEKRNKFKRHAVERVLSVQFEDGAGLLLDPNAAMLRTLVALFGAETDLWAGHRVTVFLQQQGGRKFRTLMRSDNTPAAAPPAVRTFTRDNPPPAAVEELSASDIAFADRDEDER